MAYNKINFEDYPSTRTPITAANLNKMDSQIKANADDVATLKEEVPEVLTGTLSAGATQLIFNNDAITEDCTYLIWTDIYGVSPTEIALTDGALGTKWKAQSKDMNILIKVYKGV